ncbi:hypothetical protein NRB56_75370 [Nocardia sp. RB56]|uniref:Uncharacterized protein n=1 Tax=Nocardia aurantia TaxID=2585199 RepID=A0A7K0E1P1_9NOCA|nr:hypothetical protein [Nocardia aurantia]
MPIEIREFLRDNQFTEIGFGVKPCGREHCPAR